MERRFVFLAGAVCAASSVLATPKIVGSTTTEVGGTTFTADLPENGVRYYKVKELR